MCSCVMRANCKHERHIELGRAQNWYHRSSPNSRSTTYYTAPSWETRRHGTRAPSGTDSLALEAMSEGPLIQHSSSALIGNA
ncbi:hypothetical protein PAPYR_8822 [Paratrimastix pyriformis]|uniref:Uncharacterized protein n=1 Tax=Paratrimastix pyriformis TaxID=342808 RepID=A0ABQ8UGX2_9EUKA|nr:hypothetical protein PAPYR_8822 [Paratrimastix pyriformis]